MTAATTTNITPPPPVTVRTAAPVSVEVAAEPTTLPVYTVDGVGVAVPGVALALLFTLSFSSPAVTTTWYIAMYVGCT